MLSSIIAFMLATTPAAATPANDVAGNRMEALTAQGVAARDDLLPATACDGARRWCATLRRDGASGPWELLLFSAGPQSAPRHVALPEAPEGDDESELSVWPFLVREADGALLIGVTYYRRTMYSGGGAGVERLRLLRLTGEAALVTVLETPIGASSTVRACFSPADARARRQVCHDEYLFTGTLTLDPSTTAGRPHFILTAIAQTYPGRLIRSEDSRERGALRRRDLVHWRDPACSYTRRFAPDAAGGYAPEQPLPPCSDYLDI